MNNLAYERITERIVTLLEQGTVPWRKPWQAKTGWPRNYFSQKKYRGINVFLLTAMRYESPCWLTFRQATQIGGTVRKGEKACPVVFWKPMKITDRESGEDKKIPLLRIYHVFNAAQCDGLNDALPVVDEITTVKPAEIVAHMPEPPVIKHGMASAFYSPKEDSIGMPMRERFESEERYYATLFHELIHSTGHEKRLKRSTLTENGGFGSDPYCKEELIAEMGGAFLCGRAEIAERTIDSSAAYIKGWLGRLQNDKTLIVQAAAQAQKAADFILGENAVESGGSGMKDVNPEIFTADTLKECPVQAEMKLSEPSKLIESQPTRTLKIEAHGDIWKGLIKPKIRLMGYWLEWAGFKPGNRVHVKCVAPGVIELHSRATPME